MFVTTKTETNEFKMCRDPEYNDIKTKGLSTLIADCLFQNITNREVTL